MKKILGILMVCFLGIGAYGCGSSGSITGTDDDGSDLTSSLDSLSDIPDSAEMFTENSSASSSISAMSVKDLALKAVSGTPPLLKNISSGNVDDYFWGGMIADITGAGSATEGERMIFWGEGDDGSAGGELGCRMAQTTGYTMQQIISSGISLCYMKSMPEAVGDDNITDHSDLGVTAANVFDRSTADKLVKVNSTGGSEEMGGDQEIFLKVYGTDTVGSNIYKVEIWMCADEATEAHQYNVITANLSSSAVSVGDTSYAANSITVQDAGNHNFGGSPESMTSTVTGTLKVASDGSIAYDESAERTASFQMSSSNFAMKSQIVVSGENQITTREYMVMDGGCTNKVYALIGFSGASFDELRFSEAGTKGQSICDEGTFDFGGGVQFQDLVYNKSSSSSYATTANSFDFSSDSFYDSEPGTVSVDTSSYSCSESPDVEVAMDMAADAVSTLAASCEGKMMQNMNWCDGEGVQAVRSIIMSGGGGE